MKSIFALLALLFLFGNTSYGQPPENDDCSNAVPILLNTVVQGNTIDATPSETSISCPVWETVQYPDVWYSVTLTEESPLGVTLRGSGAGSRMAFYGGGCDNLDQIVCSEDVWPFDSVYFQLESLPPGAYHMRVFNDYLDNFEFELELSPEICELGEPYDPCDDGDPGTVYGYVTVDCECIGDPVVENDNICTATELVCGETYHGDYYYATPSGLDICNGAQSKDVWFTFEADGSTAYFFMDSRPDNFMQLFKADSCSGELIEVEECLLNPGFDNGLFGGSYAQGTYYLRLAGEAANDQYGLSFYCTDPDPANTTACTALEFDCDTDSFNGTNFLANINQICSGNGFNQVRGLWYKFVPDADYNLTLDMCDETFGSADFLPRITVFTGTECGELECVDSYTSTSECDPIANITTFQGGQYYFLISGSTPFYYGRYEVAVSCELLSLDCPGLGDIGDQCDDGSPITTDDVVLEECTCQGDTAVAGRFCPWPIVINELPYTGADNTSGYADDYSGTDLPDLGPEAIVGEGTYSKPFIKGDDVVYAYTPQNDIMVDIFANDDAEGQMGVWVMTGCPFQETVAYATQTEELDASSEIYNIPLTAGVTYHIVISSKRVSNNFQSIDYELTISESVDDCPLLDGDLFDPCDDGNPATLNDSIDANCICVGAQTPTGAICANPIDITFIPYAVMTNTGTVTDYYDEDDLPPLASNAVTHGSNPENGIVGGDIVHSYTAPEDGELFIRITGFSNWQPSVFVFTGCPFSQTIGYDVSSAPDGRYLVVPILAGETYYIVVSRAVSGRPFNLAIFDCLVYGGSIFSDLPSPNVCSGDKVPDIVTLNAVGNYGPNGRFGIVNENNDIVASNQTGVFNLKNLEDGAYRFGHMSYSDSLDPIVQNTADLEGCYHVSNFINFAKTNLDGGVIAPGGPIEVCGLTGSPSVIDFEVTGNEGPSQVWALLNDLSNIVIQSGSTPDFDFGQFGANTYYVTHAAIGPGTSLGQIDPTDLPPCVSAANKVEVVVTNCGSQAPLANGETTPGDMSLTVYPNPTHGELNIELNNMPSENIVFQIVSANGTALRHWYAEGDAALRQYISTSDLNPGMYLLRASALTKTMSKKFIVD